MAGQGDVEAHAVHHFLNWDFPALRVADEEMFDDGGSELSDIRSWPDSMDIDLDPFQNEPKLFVAQYVPLPLEVQIQRHRIIENAS